MYACTIVVARNDYKYLHSLGFRCACKQTRCVQDLCLAKVVTFEVIICGEVQNRTMRFLLGLSIYNFRANRFGLVIFMRRMVILSKMAPPWRMRVSR